MSDNITKSTQATRGIALVQYYDDVNGYAVLKDCIQRKKYKVNEMKFILDPGSSLKNTIYPNRYVEFDYKEDEVMKVTDVGGSALCEFVLNCCSDEKPIVSFNDKINRNTWPRIIAMVTFFDFSEGYGVLFDAVHNKRYYVEAGDFVLDDNACLSKSIYLQKMVEFDSITSEHVDKAVFVTDVGCNPIANSVFSSSQNQLNLLLKQLKQPRIIAELNGIYRNQYSALAVTITEEIYRPSFVECESIVEIRTEKFDNK